MFLLMAITVDSYRLTRGKTALARDTEKAFQYDTFGVGCKPDWFDLINRQMVVDALECPDGLTQEQVDCLIQKISDNC